MSVDVFQNVSRASLDSVRAREPLTMEDVFTSAGAGTGENPLACQLPNIVDVAQNQPWLIVLCNLTLPNDPETASGRMRYDATTDLLSGSLMHWHPEPGHEPFGGIYQYIPTYVFPHGGAYVLQGGTEIHLSYFCMGRNLFAQDDAGKPYVFSFEITHI